MRYGIKQGGFQLFAPAQRLGMAGTFERITQFSVEALYLDLSGFRFLGAAPGPCRELTRSNSSNQKGRQRDPVLGVCYHESLNWWQKKEVKRDHA
jgi:hypothetical protein